ncbi:FAD-binding protein [Companilactobacillus ginsenosidimutans]|uniref:Urocanate reductase n=1 Tax=Companilactobacillus ginsenosidimutans TaxID=1007676 RepID=A0A0H4QKW7_9LACO|nr:FAD-binding protein [Companilactobacillus ginsenosidimutans]AKP67358.1 fumarate reductase [Companilactobacillus ginsenosidimutans]
MVSQHDIGRWDASYDVVVLGFGGAGATAARFAADDGAKTLLVDSAPEGHEGGNTRYAAQLINCGDNFDGEKEYYKNLTKPMDLDEDMIDTYVEGMVDMPNYLTKYLGVESPINAKDKFSADSIFASMIAEYPEYGGSEANNYLMVHDGIFDAALWKILRQKVLDRADMIDVWYKSPAQHLIQDPITKEVIGVQIEREHVVRNIRAKNGVIMTMGGFENNKQMMQDYTGAFKAAPLGSIYNKGDGVKMAEEIGADMWHMHNYESLGLLHGLAFDVPEGTRAQLILSFPEIVNGSVITVGDDGSRYFDESTSNRHGHIFQNGHWRVPATNVHPYLIFDQAQYDRIKAAKDLPYKDFFNVLTKADSIKDLAKLIDVNPKTLNKTVKNFNQFAENGTDYAWGRDPESMIAFSDGPFYAAPLTHNVLNTQGGARRNTHAEVLDPSGNLIPHLYSAGEFGGINANEYQGGQNLAECLIFGKIAGENAAVPKATYQTTAPAENNQPAEPVAVAVNLGSDAKPNNEEFTTADNQYLGKSNSGMGGEVVVRVTVDDGSNIQNVEILQQSESDDVASDALAELPKRIVDQNTYDVDSISGASASSRAIKDAVKDALSKANQPA